MYLKKRIYIYIIKNNRFIFVWKVEEKLKQVVILLINFFNTYIIPNSFPTYVHNICKYNEKILHFYKKILNKIKYNEINMMLYE